VTAAALSWFGSAKGPVQKLSPDARLLTGSAVLLSSVVSLHAPAHDALFSLILCGLYLALCRIPFHMTVKFVLSFSGILIISFSVFALPTFIHGFAHAAGHETNSPGTGLLLGIMFAKTLSASLISLGMLTTVTYDELYRSLSRLPIPETPRLLMLQIIHQTSILFTETIRLKRAITTRSNLSTFRGRFLVARQLPQTWLLKIYSRSEQVSRAMELRNYGIAIPQSEGLHHRAIDFVSVGFACTLLILLLINSFLKFG
jgi:hypothetical protein